ncbi:hypothetical protein HMPREF1640_03520 [Prevotella sp. S7-1-8]|uniref:hypothetical protein n=1 Tax=Prevotella sp. S7-1-8 TaxID=1284775 RepID=UPI00050FE377|nr:hypothetical protein [Prevotella sp. S7-1-8]KGF18512.1 hypothetical protein HMPREF1640_03520 [Prevotella sp. S7-1-8]
MYIHGHFYNQLNERIEVHILTKGSHTPDIEIGAKDSGISWTDDPVDITSQVSDTFDALLCQQASVRLLTKNFVPDFFCASCWDAVVNIYREGECLFAGFVEPQTYSQGYNEDQDEIELSCIDVLTAMRYAKYRGVGTPGVAYAGIKATANQRTMADIVMETLKDMTKGVDIKGKGNLTFLYDGSRALDRLEENKYQVFSQLSVNELLFLGDDEDEVWQQDEVLGETLKYLNLHIRQEGFTFYIFAWESVKSQQPIRWRDLVSAQESVTTRQRVDISNANVVGQDTTISVGEVYNQLLLTCKTGSVENVIESPFDNDTLGSPYNAKQKYMTEYSCDGEGETSIDAFDAITHGRTTGYGGATITDWFVRVMENRRWRFPVDGIGDIMHLFNQGGRYQQALPNALTYYDTAALIAFGKVEQPCAVKDNAPIAKVQMTNYLVVSVNGNGIDNNPAEVYPNERSLKASIPRAVYEGSASGGVFSPSDDKTTNYIVISGNVILNPITPLTDNFRAINDYKPSFPFAGRRIMRWWHHTVPAKNNRNKYYTQQWWKADTPAQEPTWDRDTTRGLVPFTGSAPEQVEFNYSAIGDGTDRISKVAVLACMLIIGDKCVVEEGDGGSPGNFKWEKYFPREKCASDDVYYQQSFTIGFNPKIGDKLIGRKFDIQNNISYKMGIDVEGMAIPIRKSDKVSGQVKFMILGPVNATWENITRRHPTFFRHTKWTSNTISLLANVSSILIEDFQVKAYSDNGMTERPGDSDIVYMSDDKQQFVNRKDDIEFKINSALTSEECRQLGVAQGVCMSTPLNLLTGDGVVNIYDHTTGRQAKPEQLYVDSYYNEYHQPRILMTQKLTDKKEQRVSTFNHYRHPALGKYFFVQGITRNLESGEAEMALKEMET